MLKGGMRGALAADGRRNRGMSWWWWCSRVCGGLREPESGARGGSDVDERESEVGDGEDMSHAGGTSFITGGLETGAGEERERR